MHTRFLPLVFGWLILLACSGSALGNEKVRAAAIDFARGWDSSIQVLGFSGLSSPTAFLEYKDKLDPLRKVLQAEGSKEVREAGARLDRILSYVALTHFEATEARMDAFRWRDPKDKQEKDVPLVFRNAAFNTQLGIRENEQDPQKIFDAVRRATLEFAKISGVERELLAERKEVSVK